MLNVDQLLGQILGSSQGKALAGGLLVGGLAGAMTGKTGRKVAGTALKIGGAAVVAGIAYKAYQHYQASRQPQAGVPARMAAPAIDNAASSAKDPPSITTLEESGFLPLSGDTSALSKKLMQAMISAAKADGRIDAQESQVIFAQVEALGLSADERQFLLAAMDKPLSVDEIAVSAQSSEEAAEIYTAAVLAVGQASPAEALYLARLEQRLQLDPALVQAIRAQAAGL